MPLIEQLLTFYGNLYMILETWTDSAASAINQSAKLRIFHQTHPHFPNITSHKNPEAPAK